MFEYLNDMNFLTALDKLRIKSHYAKIVLLSFDEKPIREIQGNITSGNLSVNGSSSVRRTINLTMLADETNSNLENIDNEISINKKVKVYVGYKNPLKSYAQYGDIVWFKCGMYVLSSANISCSTSGWTISISGKDKMCLLDGTVGGTFPASVTFHESYIYDNEGNLTIVNPTIFQIIYEAVNHWGGEAIENIIISDLEETVRLLVKYIGGKPIYFNNDYTSFDFTPSENFPEANMISYGEDAGYRLVDFTYPGELILDAGDTVTDLLDKIIAVLGNYEYFYDLDGRFVFQEIKNYLNTGSPLDELSEEDYTKSYNNAKFMYSLTDLDTTTAITRNPNFDNIKNDFYVWGKRTTSNDVEVDIRYHLAIDTKPDIEMAGQYMWAVKDSGTGLLIRYDFNQISSGYTVEGYETELVGIPCTEWREELYRRAMNAQVTNSVYDNYYDSELIAEWRRLYDPMNENWNSYDHWNPDVFNNPENINYWLDFIDTGSAMGRYSIGEIGRRTIVESNDSYTSIYNKEAPDIIFIDGYDPDLIEHYVNMGQRFFILTDEYQDLFVASSTGTSCFDKIREMLYQNLNYNTTMSITCFPKYYMEPNNIIHIEDKKSNINGNYQITQFTLPLTYNGTMSITATQVLTRI